MFYKQHREGFCEFCRSHPALYPCGLSWLPHILLHEAGHLLGFLLFSPAIALVNPSLVLMAHMKSSQLMQPTLFFPFSLHEVFGCNLRAGLYFFAHIFGATISSFCKCGRLWATTVWLFIVEWIFRCRIWLPRVEVAFLLHLQSISYWHA